MGKIESQRSVFDRLGSNPQAPKRKSIHDRLGVVQNVKNNASHPVEAEPSKRPRSMIPSRENEESVGSSDDVAPPQGEEASSFHITLCDELPIEGEDAEEAPHELEEGVRAAIDELKEVNLGTPENPRPIFISTLLSDEDEEIYVELLKEYIDVFAWTYKEMPGLDPKVAVHRLAVKKACRPVKQAQRRFRPELIPSIEGEVNKFIEAGFIREVKYPTWISSIVPVRKKNGQIRVCVDFRDLNVACPKDDFPLPITELMIDAVTGHEIMSFMDGSSGYNQIRMAPEDEELTAFRTPKGIYCYKVMPFGLKNAGATYQRAMQRIFDDMFHKMVECYVDDLVVKSKLRTDHLGHLRKVFDRLRKFQLKMNPLKCAFGVAAGNRAKDAVRSTALIVSFATHRVLAPPVNLAEHLDVGRTGLAVVGRQQRARMVADHRRERDAMRRTDHRRWLGSAATWRRTAGAERHLPVATASLDRVCRDHGKCGPRHRVEVLILAMELKSLSKCDVAVIQKEVSTILTRRAKPRRVFALKNPLTSINSVVMLSTAFSGRSDHLWRQQHEAKGLEVSIEISPSNGNPPSMYKSRSDMDISSEERFSEEVKYIFSSFPVSWSVNEFASKIDVVTPLDLIINYAIPQRGKDVRGRFVFQSRLQTSANWEKEGRSLNSISGDEGPLLNHLLEPMERKKSEGKRRSKWKRPPETTLKLNMDSALAKETRTTRVGAIIRDHNGQFVAAMVKTARSSTLYPKGLHMLSQLQVSSRLFLVHGGDPISALNGEELRKLQRRENGFWKEPADSGGRRSQHTWFRGEQQ
nr:uncharacterized protein LOC109150426 [Ipomoea batatas]